MFRYLLYVFPRCIIIIFLLIFSKSLFSSDHYKLKHFLFTFCLEAFSTMKWTYSICISYICIVGTLLLAALIFQRFFYCEPLKITTMICIRDTGHLKLTQGFIQVCTTCTLVILSMVILRCAMFYSDQQRPCTLHPQIYCRRHEFVFLAEDLCIQYNTIP